MWFWLALIGCGEKDGDTGADADGDGDAEADADGDGYTEADGDCDDTDAAVHPGAGEICDGIDNNCDGTTDEDATTIYYQDTDGDGFGDTDAAIAACELPEGHVAAGGDCDDDDATIHPKAGEICDGIDNNCDGTTDEDATTIYYQDTDGDGFGVVDKTTAACDQPEGYVADSSDCDDADAAVHPGAGEVCDGIDNDCNGDVDEDSADDASIWYADADGDSFGDDSSTTTACEAPGGHVSDTTDCDDSDSAVNPDADEVCDGVDNDCDGDIDLRAIDDQSFYADDDGDGYGDDSTRFTSCEAPSGYITTSGDCDDTDEDISPDAAEDCEDEVDNDCDGLLNCEDGDCAGEAMCEEDCEDGIDNDDDGLADCDDDDCAGMTECAPVYARVTGGWMSINVNVDELLSSGRVTRPDNDYMALAYSVSGTVRMPPEGFYWSTATTSTTCTWQVQTATAVGRLLSSAYIFSGSSRQGFTIEEGCPLSTSAFLPRLFVFDSYAGFSSGGCFGTWCLSADGRWYGGSVLSSGSSLTSSAGSRSGTRWASFSLSSQDSYYFEP